MDFVHSCPSIVVPTAGSAAAAALTTEASIPKPQLVDLRTLFVASAIPMVGFGFMDQFVLIQAGGYIDATLGVSLGLATMTAAAAGAFFCACYNAIFIVSFWN